MPGRALLIVDMITSCDFEDADRDDRGRRRLRGGLMPAVRIPGGATAPELMRTPEGV